MFQKALFSGFWFLFIYNLGSNVIRAFIILAVGLIVNGLVLLVIEQKKRSANERELDRIRSEY